MKFLVLVLFVSFIAGCGSTPVVKQPPAIDEAELVYRLGVGDRVAVNVWKAPELSLAVVVRPDGKISVPLIGDVRASGQTPQNLSLVLEDAFSAYVRSPKVAVVVVDPVSAEFLRRVRVTGAVAQPLSIAHQPGMTVLDLVLQAGGITDFAQANSAKLYRKYGDKVDVYPVYLDDILNKGALDSNYQLSPSDIVAIPERVF